MKNLTFFVLTLVLLPLLGSAQWTSNVSENTMIYDDLDDQVLPKVVVNPSTGDSYVSWFSTEANYPFYVFMQQLDADGNKLWDDDGLLISDNPTMTWVTDYDLKIDNEGNAILVTQDERTGSSNVFTYKISPDGNFLWGNDGIALSDDEGFNPSPKAMMLDDNSAIFGWEHESATQGFSQINLQKLSADGTPAWPEYSVISNDSMYCLMPNFVNSDNNSVIAAWVEVEHVDTAVGNWPNMYIYAQKIDSDGNFVWDQKVAVDSSGNMPLKPFSPSMKSDGNGGLLIAWMAFPAGPNYSSYVQHITADGEMQWQSNGIAVSDSVQFVHSHPKIEYLKEYDETYVFWYEYRMYGETDVRNAIFAQKFASDGSALWQAGGQAFDGMYEVYDTTLVLHNVCSDEDGNLTVFFEKEFYEFGSNDTLISANLHAMKINRDGQFIWDVEKPLISNAASNKFALENSLLFNDQWVVVWADNRNDPEHENVTGIYAQNITNNGMIGPTAVEEAVAENARSLSAIPNPFSNFLSIRFDMPEQGPVKMDLYSIDGSLITNIVNYDRPKGISEIEINTSSLANGIYLLRLETAGGVNMKKIVKGN